MSVTIYQASTTLTQNQAALQTLRAYYTPQNYLITAIQTLCLADDETAEAYLVANRVFVGNTTGGNLTVTMGGTAFTITNAKYYCCTENEAGIMLTQQPTLVRGASTDFVANGIAQFFTE